MKKSKKVSKAEMERRAKSRFTEPFIEDVGSMTKAQKEKFKKIMRAHRAAMKGDFKLGEELGVFSTEPD